MAVDERRRKVLHDALEQRIGSEEAATLMELLPPVGWADVATKHDLHQLELRLDLRLVGLRDELKGEIGSLRSELKGEIGSLRSELKGEIGSLRGELKGEIGSLRSELKGEIGSLRGELKGEIGSLRGELKGEIGSLRSELRGDLERMGRRIVMWTASTVVAMAGLAFAAGRFI